MFTTPNHFSLTRFLSKMSDEPIPVQVPINVMAEVITTVAGKLGTRLSTHPAIDRIVLLQDLNVIRWLIGDCGFMEPPGKLVEDLWGKSRVKTTGKGKMWTGAFGEAVLNELLLLFGHTTAAKKARIDGFIPDQQTDTTLYEVKNGTY